MAVKDLAATARMYEQGGYNRSSFVLDPIQRVHICWMTKNDSPTVELISPVDETSPIFNILQKVGVSPYHCCYIVDSIDEASIELKKQKYIMLSKPTEAVAINGSKICFFFHKDVGLIELVEAPANIIK